MELRKVLSHSFLYGFVACGSFFAVAAAAQQMIVPSLVGGAAAAIAVTALH